MNKEGDYIHCIDPSNWLACYNLTLNPFLSSPDFIAQRDPGLAAQHQSLRGVPFDSLRQTPFPPGVVTPRVGLNLITGAILESSGHVGIGAERTVWLSSEQEKRIHGIWQLELDFEKRRREIAPEAASRLCCLWLAQDTELGRTHIQTMFGADLPILHVTVVESSRLTRVDTTWFDRYLASGDGAFVDAYWRGSALNSGAPRWEILLEGTVSFDPAEIAALHHTASQLPSWPEGLPRK